jgi:integrase
VEFNSESPAQTSLPWKDYPKWLEAWRAIEVGPKAPARQWYHLFCAATGCRGGEASRIKWKDVKPAQRIVEIPGAKAGNLIQIPMSALIARILKRARDVGEPGEFVFAQCGQAGHRDDLPARGHDLRHSWRSLAAEIGIDDLLCHFMLGHQPRNISEKYITRLVLAAGSAVRQAQRKVSQKLVALWGADPTLAASGHSNSKI